MEGIVETGGMRRGGVVLGAVVGVLAFAGLFLLADQAYFRLANAQFPQVGASATLATLWGLVSRLHVILPVAVVAVWRRHFIGLHVGSSRERWRMLTLLLLINCGVVAAFILLSGATPYSGNQWLLTEVVIVPVVEELAWRGVVLSTVLAVLDKAGVGDASTHIGVWVTGIAFGVLHLGNALAGVPVGFVLVQAASAAVWGVMYGYARTSTDSVLPAIGLHAAMNLVVVLLG